MSSVSWTPPYPAWHDYNAATGVGHNDTPVNSTALAALVAGIQTAIDQGNAAMNEALTAAGLAAAYPAPPVGTPAGYVLTVQADGSVTWAAPTGGGSSSSAIVANLDGTATSTTASDNNDGTATFTSGTDNLDDTATLS